MSNLQSRFGEDSIAPYKNTLFGTAGLTQANLFAAQLAQDLQ